MRKRNYGLDIARIAAMCGVVVLHILGTGGVLAELKPLQASYVTSWWLEILAYGSVNVFAMLSCPVFWAPTVKRKALIVHLSCFL